MSTDIISGNSTDLLTIDPTSKAARATLYDTAGAPISPATAGGLTAGTSKSQMLDFQFNQTAQVDNLRRVAIAHLSRLFGDSFADGIGAGEEDSGAFPAAPTVTGSATGSAANGSFNMVTGATIPSTGIFQSVNVAPFLTGSVSNHQGAIQFPSANLTDYRVVSRRASVDTPIESSAFNVVPTPITNSGLSNALAGALIDGNYHRNEIFYQGNAAVFSVDGNVVHRMSGNTASPRTDTLDFNFTYEWFNVAGPIATLRVGNYTTTNGYFFECRYNVANVSFAARGASANRYGALPRTYRIVEGFDSLKTRVVIKFEAVAPAVADTLLSIVKQTAGVDAGGATSIGAATNRVLRITGYTISCKANAAAAAFCTLTLRQNPSGATVIGSPSWGRMDIGTTAAVISDAKSATHYFGEAQDFSGANTLGMSLASSAITNIMSIELYGFEFPVSNA